MPEPPEVTAAMESHVCGSCGRTFFFAKSPAGAMIPLVLRKVPTYDVALIDGELHAVRARDETAYISHFVDCPNAAAWARGGRPRIVENRPRGSRPRPDGRR